MERRKIRIGLEDVAQRAGVGIATVDRVLNERGGVSAKAEQRVLEAARALGLRRQLPTPHARSLRIEVILARPTTPFMKRLGMAVGQVAATLDRSISILRTSIDMTDPSRVAPRIRSSRADGIIIYCEEQLENIAAIHAATTVRRPVICVVTDVPDSPRIAYVGIDHGKAGRTAGFFAARMGRQHGTALIISTSTGFRAHKQRIEGFRDALNLHAPGIKIAPVMTTNDEAERAYHCVMRAMRDWSDLVAIYNTGGGNEGVGHALHDGKHGDPVIFIGHELTEESIGLLRDGVMTLTIDQAPELQARCAIDLMLSHLGRGTDQAMSSEIAFSLHTMENC
ncbi:LacI family transcriptional regulator (plasmid) [Acidiphilium multivorum AIU301]|uniref:LacI family transcriptional regulator n=1 Tax=Acidiphilium multivorum (strain DSM 11245 / JCM 8867 / NBRC 100883 / AIU 301) TaxID=926570 RepID=F0J773_ACIMA|nr:LacI family DNA-binding transcriptional regulator [Acidiphilium multivorum]BAJ82940.1 LacI family transcriptional regulator [Acidiphilium multivorum AIU301]GAN75640.1 transcriptional regulator LacI [Acidiphilium multivorum AIU301]